MNKTVFVGAVLVLGLSLSGCSSFSSSSSSDVLREQLKHISDCKATSYAQTKTSITLTFDEETAAENITCLAGALQLSQIQKQQILASTAVMPFQTIQSGDLTIGWSVSLVDLRRTIILTMEWPESTGVELVDQ